MKGFYNWAFGLSALAFLSGCTSMPEQGNKWSPASIPVTEFNKTYHTKFTAQMEGRYLIAIEYQRTEENVWYMTCVYGARSIGNNPNCPDNLPVLTATYAITSSSGETLFSANDVQLESAFYGDGYAGAQLGYLKVSPGETYFVTASLNSTDQQLLTANPTLIVRAPADRYKDHVILRQVTSLGVLVLLGIGGVVALL